MRVKINPEDIMFSGILIEAHIVKPGRKVSTIEEKFTYCPTHMLFKRNNQLDPSDDIEWSVHSNDDKFIKEFNFVASKLRDFDIFDPSYQVKGTETYVLIRLCDGSKNPRNFAFTGHPRIAMMKEFNKVLKRIADHIPHNCRVPFALDNLG